MTASSVHDGAARLVVLLSLLVAIGCGGALPTSPGPTEVARELPAVWAADYARQGVVPPV